MPELRASCAVVSCQQTTSADMQQNNLRPAGGIYKALDGRNSNLRWDVPTAKLQVSCLMVDFLGQQMANARVFDCCGFRRSIPAAVLLRTGGRYQKQRPSGAQRYKARSTIPGALDDWTLPLLMTNGTSVCRVRCSTFHTAAGPQGVLDWHQRWRAGDKVAVCL